MFPQGRASGSALTVMRKVCENVHAMGRLPNAEQAFVPEGKIETYLLSPAHAVGRAKAAFFTAAGFSISNPEALERGLLSVAQQGVVTQQVASEYGTKYVVDGWLQTPTGRRVAVRTVWIIERERPAPRLVTAYPLEEESQ